MMSDFRKLVFEKIKFEKLKINKTDYAVLVEKGAEQGLEESQIKKQVFSCLKELKAFKQNTLPLSILEERDVEMEAEELYIPAEVLKAWREEMEGKLKELEKILASTSSEELDSFLAQNPEMQSASKVPLSQFVKALHKDVEMPSQNLGEKFEANDVADKEKPDEADENESATPVEHLAGTKTGTDGQSLKKKKWKKIAIIFLIVLFLKLLISLFLSSDQEGLSDYYQDKFQYGEITDSRDGQKYRTIWIGSQVWIVQNMNYAVEGSICDSCDVYGRLYTYSMAKQACPAGFVLPTYADYKALRNLSDKNQDWRSVLGWDLGEDRFGFAALPSGFYSRKDFLVKRRGEMAGYWLAESRADFALRLKIDQNETLRVDALENDYGFSVRCVQAEYSVKDKEMEYYFSENGKFREFDISSFTDSRDGKIYNAINIEGQIWIAENVNYETNGSYCYEEEYGNCQKYGRLYTWDAAQSACPDDFRLPTLDEWKILIRNVGGQDLAGYSLKSSGGWHDDYTGNGSNAFGFKALPGGFRNSEGEYFDLSDYASFWSASEADSQNGYYVSISYEDALAELDKSDKHYAQSVRCVKNP